MKSIRYTLLSDGSSDRMLISGASELSSTRLKKLRPQQRAHLVAQAIEDFTPLRSLSAFRALEDE